MEMAALNQKYKFFDSTPSRTIDNYFTHSILTEDLRRKYHHTMRGWENSDVGWYTVEAGSHCIPKDGFDFIECNASKRLGGHYLCAHGRKKNICVCSGGYLCIHENKLAKNCDICVKRAKRVPSALDLRIEEDEHNTEKEVRGKFFMASGRPSGHTFRKRYLGRWWSCSTDMKNPTIEKIVESDKHYDALDDGCMVSQLELDEAFLIPPGRQPRRRWMQIPSKAVNSSKIMQRLEAEAICKEVVKHDREQKRITYTLPAAGRLVPTNAKDNRKTESFSKMRRRLMTMAPGTSDYRDMQRRFSRRVNDVFYSGTQFVIRDKTDIPDILKTHDNEERAILAGKTKLIPDLVESASHSKSCKFWKAQDIDSQTAYWQPKAHLEDGASLTMDFGTVVKISELATQSQPGIRSAWPPEHDCVKGSRQTLCVNLNLTKERHRLRNCYAYPHLHWFHYDRRPMTMEFDLSFRTSKHKPWQSYGKVIHRGDRGVMDQIRLCRFRFSPLVARYVRITPLNLPSRNEACCDVCPVFNNRWALRYAFYTDTEASESSQQASEKSAASGDQIVKVAVTQNDFAHKDHTAFRHNSCTRPTGNKRTKRRYGRKARKQRRDVRSFAARKGDYEHVHQLKYCTGKIVGDPWWW